MGEIKLNPLVTPTRPTADTSPDSAILDKLGDKLTHASETSAFLEAQARDSAPASAFDAKRDELARAGLQALGNPVDQFWGPSDRVAQRDYQNYTLIHCDGQIRVIREPIRARWHALGGADWGLPAADDAPTQDGHGRELRVDLVKPGPGGSLKAAIIWSEILGAHHVTGKVLKKFLSLGGIPVLGYPVEGTVPTLPKTGERRNAGVISEFRKIFSDEMRSAIVLKHGTNEPFWVMGDIYKYWHSLGSHLSPAGFPKSDEFAAGGLRRGQYFESGAIYWLPDPQHGAHFEMPPFHIRFNGFSVGRSRDDGEFDNNLEFYFGVSAIPKLRSATESITTKLPPDEAEYANLRTGRWRHADVVVYQGSTDFLLLTITGAERDNGDPDKYKEALTKASRQVIEKSVGALLALIGGPGAAAGAAAADGAIQALADELGSAINDAIDTGDEALHPKSVPLDLKTLLGYLSTAPVYADARNADGSAAAPIPYHFEVHMDGHDFNVRLYFQVVHGLP